MNLRRHPLRILFALTILTLSACKEETAAPRAAADAEAYFPLELDRSSFYRFDSIIVRNTVRGIVYDTATLEVRETLVESFVGADGQENFRGERWERVTPEAPWTFKQTYTLSRSNAAAFRSEDNLLFTKLTFPIRRGKRWEGNDAFDSTRDFPVGGEFLDVYADWQYRYGPVDTSINLFTGVNFDNTVFVRQADVDNVIDYRQAYERYAPGIGLVERFLDARHTQCNSCCGGDFGTCADLPWDDKAEKGFILRQVFLRRE